MDPSIQVSHIHNRNAYYIETVTFEHILKTVMLISYSNVHDSNIDDLSNDDLNILHTGYMENPNDEISIPLINILIYTQAFP